MKVKLWEFLKTGKRRVPKTRKMQEIEQELGEPLEAVLKRLYSDEKRSTVEIASLLGVSSTAVTSWLQNSGIRIRPLRTAIAVRWSRNKPSVQRLRQWYRDDKKSARAIGQIVGVDGNTITKWLKEAGIPRRTQSELALLRWGKNVRRPSPRQLRQWYVGEQKSMVHIAQLVGVGDTAIRAWLQQAGIPLRTAAEATRVRWQQTRPSPPSPAQLRQWYVQQQKTTYEIAAMLGVVNSTVRVWLHQAGIPRRNRAEVNHLRFGTPLRRPSPTQLRRWYTEEKKSTIEIEGLIGVSNTTMRRWLSDAGIERRSISEAARVRAARK